MSFWSQRVCFSAFLFTVMWCPSALAQSSTAVRAELEAPAGCPDADRFLREILKRAPGARSAVAAEAAKRYRATVRRDGTGFSGIVQSESLAVTDASMAHGQTCDAVVTALAMTVALSLDADPIDTALPVQESARLEPVETPKAVARRDPATVETPSAPKVWGIAAEGLVLGGGLPTLFGGNASVSWRTDRSGVWAPSLRLGGGFLADGGLEEVALRLPFMMLDACPSLVELGRLRLSPCLHNIVGLLRGEARSPRPGKPAQLLFAASGVEARLEWISEPVVMGVRSSVLGVWSAPTFRSQPSGLALAEVGALAVDAGLGFGVTF